MGELFGRNPPPPRPAVLLWRRGARVCRRPPVAAVAAGELWSMRRSPRGKGREPVRFRSLDVFLPPTQQQLNVLFNRADWPALRPQRRPAVLVFRVLVESCALVLQRCSFNF